MLLPITQNRASTTWDSWTTPKMKFNLFSGNKRRSNGKLSRTVVVFYQNIITYQITTYTCFEWVKSLKNNFLWLSCLCACMWSIRKFCSFASKTSYSKLKQLLLFITKDNVWPNLTSYTMGRSEFGRLAAVYSISFVDFMYDLAIQYI